MGVSSFLYGFPLFYRNPVLIPGQMQYRAEGNEASYNLAGTVLDNIENIKYLGITIAKD